MDKTISEQQLEAIAEEMCNSYCKHPLTWDEEKEGVPLAESEICASCPMSRL